MSQEFFFFMFSVSVFLETMEGNLPSNKNQELNIRQSFLHLNNSNSKACVKIFSWKDLTALLTSNYKKKCNIYLSKQNNLNIFSL